MPGVDTPLPAYGAGFYAYGSLLVRYGQPAVIEAIRRVAVEWRQAHPGQARLGVGDISLRGGGPCPGHKGHRQGWEVDLRPVRIDFQERPVSIGEAVYASALTQELVDRLWGNGAAWVRGILFNDGRVQGARRYAGHDNHLHVRFSPRAIVLAVTQSGDGVAQVQRRLNVWLAGQEKAPLLVDGRFGPRTQAAVRAYQSWHGMEDDGVIGESTWAELIRLRPWELR